MIVQVDISNEVEKAIKEEVQKQLGTGGLYPFIRQTIQMELDKRWRSIPASIGTLHKRLVGLHMALKDSAFKRGKNCLKE